MTDTFEKACRAADKKAKAAKKRTKTEVGGKPPPNAKAPSWPDLTKESEPKRTYRNARAAITALSVTCSYDEFHDRMLVGGHVIDQWGGELSDAVNVILRQTIIDNFGLDPGKENVADAATELCLENPSNPIVKYLDGLNWDGTKRLDTWLTIYLGAKDTPLHRAVGRTTLVAAVRRIRSPGCKFDHILTLEGPEGEGKSTAIAVLAGKENFSDQTILTQSDREQQELIRGIWLYEIADLAGMRRAEVEKVKAFASRTHDRARPAYGRRRIDAPRRCIFIASTNEDEYLKSQTGNRRFWPVAIGVINVPALQRDRDQLWAEAAQAEATGEAITLASSFWADAATAQDKRREYDPWDDILAEVTGITYRTVDGQDEEERIASTELYKVHLAMPTDRMGWYDSQRLKRAMHRLGWQGPEPLQFGPRRARGYFRGKFMESASGPFQASGPSGSDGLAPAVPTESVAKNNNNINGPTDPTDLHGLPATLTRKSAEATAGQIIEDASSPSNPPSPDAAVCAHCGWPGDHQPLRKAGNGSRTAWLHRRCEAAWFSGPDPDEVVAEVWIKIITPPGISAGPDDDLRDIDLGWRQ